MIYASMDRLGVKASRLGFGLMRLPLGQDGKIDRRTAAEMVDLAYKSGVNYFDTAYGYHSGESELFAGEALKKYPRESFYLADKLPTWLVKTREDPDRLFAEQLEKTRMDYFDFYLLHALNTERWESMKSTDTLARMREKKKEGKIRALGFSYHGTLDTFKEIVNAADWDFVQIQINYLDYEWVDSKAYHDLLCEKNIPCVVMEPIRGGLLARLPENAAAELARCGEGSSASWAMRWCLDMPNMPVILSGMSTMEQVRDNLATFASDKPLSDTQRGAIAKTREALLSKKIIPCTACRYCMDCSFGVEIPWVFETYNKLQMFGDPEGIYKEYTSGMNSQNGADKCTACGACAPQCPQDIAIPERLAEAHKVLMALK